MARDLIARIAAAGMIGFAALAVGCGDSPSSPTPVPAPVTPAPAAPAGLTLRSMAPSAGPTVGSDFVRVFGQGFQDGATVTIDGVSVPVTRTNGTSAPNGTFIEFRTLAHAEGTVDVVVTNPDGQSKTLAQSYTFAVFSVEASPGAVAPRGALTVSWHAPSGRGCSGGGDWIAIYRIGDSDETGAANGHSDLWYDHVCGATSGSWTVNAPSEPGAYEFRFMAGAGSVARSKPVRVE